MVRIRIYPPIDINRIILSFTLLCGCQGHLSATLIHFIFKSALDNPIFRVTKWHGLCIRYPSPMRYMLEWLKPPQSWCIDPGQLEPQCSILSSSVTPFVSDKHWQYLSAKKYIQSINKSFNMHRLKRHTCNPCIISHRFNANRKSAYH